MTTTEFVEVVTYIALGLIIAVAAKCFYVAMPVFNAEKG